MIVSDEQPVTREKDACQWFLFHCPSCNKEVWVYYGDKNDLSCPDANGYICCYCKAEVIYKFDADNRGAVFDSVHKDSEDSEDRVKFIEDRCMLDDSEESCPITEEEDEYDPEEMNRFRESINKLSDKALKGKLTHEELMVEIAKLSQF